MKAMVIEQFGDADVFKLDDRPVPDLKPGHVLLRVEASSVNPVDWKIRSGKIPGLAPAFPAVLHGDAAGTVEAVGDGVDGFKPGDAVYGCAGGIKGHGGALAEFMLAHADLIARKPPSLNFTEAAVLPLVGITAWEALIDRARVQPGQRVLVHGGAGGVGHLGIQLAKNAGAVVYTTISCEEKAEVARELGADVVIDYREKTVSEYVDEYTGGEGFDVVFDTIGEENLARSFEASKIGGTVASIAARSTQDLSPLHLKNMTLHVVFMLIPMLTGKGRAHHGDILTRLGRMVETRKLRPLLDPEVFSFKDVAAAHRKLEEGRAVGKIGLNARF